MIIFSSMHSQWLSNTWLVADHPGGHAVIIDTGGPVEPILAKIEELRVTLSHVLCTHHHYDHVANNAEYQRHFGCPICGHSKERKLFGDLDLELADGEELRSGDLHIRALHIPGHTLGQLGFLIDEQRVFTGDTLFKGSIGGTCAPGHTDFEDLRHSLMDVLMKLPEQTVIHPGHMEESSIAEEWERNPFIRAFRGMGLPAEKACKAFGRPASLLLSARDYDGGQKCWVRFEEGDRLDIVPGSQVQVG